MGKMAPRRKLIPSATTKREQRKIKKDAPDAKAYVYLAIEKSHRLLKMLKSLCSLSSGILTFRVKNLFYGFFNLTELSKKGGSVARAVRVSDLQTILTVFPKERQSALKSKISLKQAALRDISEAE